MTAPQRTRFAPSPTGSLHVGGVRTALYSRIVARQSGGAFLLRIEDTDRVRSSEAAAEGILRNLAWLGLSWDEGPGRDSAVGPFYQSMRLHRYDEVLAELLASGKAYEAWEDAAELEAMRKAAEAAGDALRYRGGPASPEQVATYRAQGRRPVVRLAAPRHDVTHDDLILGAVTVTGEHLDDLVLRKADGFPTYHFAVVVDDHDMGVDLILRGQEHLMNTHKHLLIYEALGWTPPRAGHLPLIFNPGGAKMSKRDKAKAAREATKAAARPEGWGWLAEKAGLDLAAVTSFVERKNDELATAEALARALGVDLPLVEVQDFRRAGYVPQAIVNYMALLGWGRDDDVEIMTMDELDASFELRRVNTTAARFDGAKMAWMNGEWMKRLELDALFVAFDDWATLTSSRLESLPEAQRREVLALYRARASTFAGIDRAVSYLFDAPTAYDAKAMRKWMDPAGREVLHQTRAALVASTWQPEALAIALNEVATSAGLGLGAVAQPLRLALTGTAVSPEIERTLALFPRDEVLRRVDALLATPA